ncbi:hypothetical protein SAMN04515647_3615 [Cohaesibacter sp. ES.047]|uniref:YbaN family protein n=1 Tax=Cohaesibacter sp. ES.047 TaxID=1798205 RepID=UPI000BB808A9|nr:YbaN family protein [Cohaesibacter sp. ES.047]SNY93321.1 hypothetical protein SAMN04515647_3615 [Cohaesibacter sp. ES.047]
MDRLKRPFFLALGLLLCAVGVVGAFLPLLPSTIFFIMAVYFFGRSSPKLEAWVLDHPIFGPPVIAWTEHKAIPRKAKLLAFAGMAFGFAMFIYLTRPDTLLLAGVALFFIASAAYVGTRPEGPKSDE